MKKTLLVVSFTVLISFSFSQNSAIEYLYSAQVNDSLKDYKAAKHDIENALLLKPEYDSALCLLGEITLKEGNFKDAVKLFDRVLKQNQNYFDAFYGRANAKAQLKDYSGAVKDFSKAILLNSNHSKAYYNRALAKGYLEDYPAAILDLNKAIALDDKYVNAYYSRAYWEDLSGDYDKAIADYKKVVQLDPSYREAYTGMATSMYQHGDKKEACEVLKTAAERGSIMAEELISKLCE